MKYEIIGDTSIIIDLHNGYSILAMSRWNKEERLYNTTLYIKKNDIDRFDLIDIALSVETDNKKELCMKVLKYVENTDFTYYVLIVLSMNLIVLNVAMHYMRKKS